MLKEALQYIIGIGNIRIENVGGQVYSTQPVHKIPVPTPEAIKVRSLSGLVDYLKSKFDGENPVMVHVESPTQVVAFSTFNRDSKRSEYIQASAMLPEFKFGTFHEPEDFIIKLQAGFVQNGDRAIVLKVVGNVQEEHVKQVGDDGVSQKVVAKTGIATVGDMKVPNPVILSPYRTFVEVEQPESAFVFRMQTGPKAALFEADGGAWKLAAMSNIKRYLDTTLDEEIKAGAIVIIA